MSREHREGHLGEQDLRARITAGSQESADYLKLAGLLRSASRFQEAADIYELGLQHTASNLDSARIALELGALRADTMGERASAVTLARKAIAYLSDERESPEVLLLRGLSYSLLAENVWTEDAAAGAGAARQTVDLLGRVIKAHGDLRDIVSAYTAAAWAHTALGFYEDAVLLCREALRCEKERGYHLRALMTLAEALRCLGRFGEATDAVEKALELAERDPAACRTLHVALGLIHRAEHRSADAQVAFERARATLREDPFSSTDRYHRRIILGNLAELLCEAGQIGSAIGMIKQLLAEYPEDDWARHRVLRWLGDSHASNGSYHEARRCYGQVLASPVVSREDRADAQSGLGSLPSSES